MSKETKIHFNHRKRYACNWAVEPRKEKMTKDWKKVTCKNCKKVNFFTVNEK